MMNRRHMSALAGLSAAAMFLAFCGCGDRKSAPHGGGPTGRAFAPAVSRSATLALGINLDGKQMTRILDAYSERLFELLKTDPGRVEKIKGKIAEYKRDPFKDMPKEAKEFIDDSGLRDVDFEWVVLSMDGPAKVVDGAPMLDGVSVAVAANVNLKKFVAAVEKAVERDGDKSPFQEVAVEGERAWRFVMPDDILRRVFGKTSVDPHLASLGGKLVLVAMSRDALAKQIRLYRDGKGTGDALRGFSAVKGEVLRLFLSGIGDQIRRNAKGGKLRYLSQSIPNGEEIVLGLKTLDIDMKMLPSGMTTSSLRLETASEEDADQIRTLLKTGLMLLKAQFARDPDAPKDVAKMIGGLKVGGRGGCVELANADVLTIIGCTIIPAISSAASAASATAASVNGRKLVMGVMAADVHRSAHGKGTLWPRTAVDDDADKDDIAGLVYRSAADYFSDLFDIGNRLGSDAWQPYLDVDIGVLGKGAASGQSIRADALDWCVAANVTDDMPGNIPVLVSANFNPGLLLRKWDGLSGRTPLPIGPASGAARSMFGDMAIVVVRKDGSAEVLKKRKLNYDSLYKSRPFDLSGANRPLLYLTPNGVAEPVGRSR